MLEKCSVCYATEIKAYASIAAMTYDIGDQSQSSDSVTCSSNCVGQSLDFAVTINGEEIGGYDQFSTNSNSNMVTVYSTDVSHEGSYTVSIICTGELISDSISFTVEMFDVCDQEVITIGGDQVDMETSSLEIL